MCKQCNLAFMKKTTYFNYIDGLSIPEWVVDSCPQSGDCSSSIREFIEDEEVRAELDLIDKDQLVKELEQYGEWDDEELKDHEENLMKILWIAINNIWEGYYDYAQYINDGIESGDIDTDELKSDFNETLYAQGYVEEDVWEWSDEHFENLLPFEENEKKFKEWFDSEVHTDHLIDENL